MSRDDVPECGEEYVSKKGSCDNAGIYEDEKCGYHSEYADGPGAPEGNDNAKGEHDSENKMGNTNAWKHGIYAKRSSYYQRVSEEEKAWIDSIVESFLEDAPFDRKHAGKVEKLRQVAVDMHKKRRANGYIGKKGMTETEVTDYDKDYGEITETSENTLHLTADRLERSSMRTLKELGVLDDPDSQQAENTRQLVDVLSSVDGE